MSDRHCAIGIDFDNTLACYDDIFYQTALTQGLIGRNAEKSKREIRDRIRQLGEGEAHWQKLQAVVYGDQIQNAILDSDVPPFFLRCQESKIHLSVISHKTEFTSVDSRTINLRAAAFQWMEGKGFFDPNGLNLKRSDIYFAGTRHEKISRIRDLKCTHFIDDLEETFLEESFPKEVVKILYAPHGQAVAAKGMSVVRSWREISDYFFGGKC